MYRQQAAALHRTSLPSCPTMPWRSVRKRRSPPHGAEIGGKFPLLRRWQLGDVQRKHIGQSRRWAYPLPMAGLKRVPVAQPGLTVGGSFPDRRTRCFGQRAPGSSHPRSDRSAESRGRTAAQGIRQEARGNVRYGIAGGNRQQLCCGDQSRRRYSMPRALPFGSARKCPTESVVLRAACAARRKYPT